MTSLRYTLGAQSTVEIDKIKGSRFIGVALPVRSVDSMCEEVLALWAVHPEARHICWAYRGDHRDDLRYVDDGEPSGTAGRPILNVIEGLELERVGVAVIRYFGGTKLGTGGLARAYSSAAQAVLTSATVVTLKLRCAIRFEVAYSFESSLMYLLAQRDAQVIDTSYSTSVIVNTVILDELATSLITEITDRTAGRALIQRGSPEWL